VTGEPFTMEYRVLGEDAVLHRERLAGRVRTGILGRDPLPVVRVDDLAPQAAASPDHLLCGVAEDVPDARADVPGIGGALFDDLGVNGRRHLLDEGPVPGLRLLEGLLGPLALGDVQHEPLPVAGAARLVA